MRRRSLCATTGSRGTALILVSTEGGVSTYLVSVEGET